VSKGEWRVQIQKWDVDNRESRIIGYDPRVFRSEKEALDGSGEWRDAYMRRFHGSRDARLRELQRISITCAGGPQTTAGLVPFLEAVLKEQEELGDSSDSLRDTRQALVWAKEQGSPNAPKRR
ncbi:MAG: hypothetical protein ABI886_10680, partial [Betaproteobacteria bacterium]